MATGSTADCNITRNGVIDAALRKVRAVNPSDQPTLEQTYQTAKALNQILREEDLAGTGQSANLWALSRAALYLVVGSQIYGTDQGLKNNILDILSMHFRNTSGEDVFVELITAAKFADIVDKDETGDPKVAYLNKTRLLADQQLWVDPVPSGLGTTSGVLGTDTLSYQCTQTHTSVAENRPISGVSWPLYWQVGGSSTTAWVTATDYTNAELLWYTYKRPLYDFDAATDNPDMPAGWGRFLIYRLAHDISSDYGLPLEERAWLRSIYKEAYENLFPSKRAVTTKETRKVQWY